MIVSVSGACSRSGKTAAAVALLQAFPPGSAVAVKFTTAEDASTRCPRGTPCLVCNIDVPFRLMEDPVVLRMPGTDTDRLAAAGARRVVWAIARASAASEAWSAVRRTLGGAPVVTEGSTAAAVARPELHVFVAHPFLLPERWKPTTPALVASADLVVVNRPAAERRKPLPSVLSALDRCRRGREVRVADVTRPLAEWAPELLARLAPAPAPALAR